RSGRDRQSADAVDQPLGPFRNAQPRRHGQPVAANLPSGTAIMSFRSRDVYFGIATNSGSSAWVGGLSKVVPFVRVVNLAAVQLSCSLPKGGSPLAICGGRGKGATS